MLFRSIEDIYQSDPKLYEIVKESFRNIFQPIKIPEDEIGYIVIYFIASMDYLSKNSISVLVVCSTGIGSSKMLRSRLEREFSEIDVKKIKGHGGNNEIILIQFFIMQFMCFSSAQ